MDHTRIGQALTISTLTLAAGAANAAESAYLEQIRTDAKEQVADNCSASDQELFDWSLYSQLEYEEAILLKIIEDIQSSSENFCLPPDVTKMLARSGGVTDPPVAIK